MNFKQGKDLRIGLAWIIGTPLLICLGIIIYAYATNPTGSMVVNEVGEPLNVGDQWQQADLYSVTLHEVKEIDGNITDQGALEVEQIRQSIDMHTANGDRVYDLRFSVKNDNYQGYRDIYQENTPFKKGMHLRIQVYACDRNEIMFSTETIYESHAPDQPIYVRETLENAHYLVAVRSEAEKIIIHFTLDKEATPEETLEEKTTPQLIYRKDYEYIL